ncbi:conserved protein of unknown function (plasmid) [Rhodovastum atsumiense]|uniref:Uncharacterized protein n=1 Tax=Rhodovastum atsumiense TaxID=504468 RepID=A0A5M6ITJ5_9PROT|nr:hypothetical protein [Rhodovastum atsumiense]KAA5611643.1 hypothetical protein F1189_13870 [Rhodovastum atsumiense]CAH2606261.1 conserved protein of unknown function [Rhodovastum atsumiense]
MPDAPQATRPISADELAILAGRMRCRVDSCRERSGSVEAAVTGPGIGIGHLLASDIVRALDNGAAEIERMRAALQRIAYSDYDEGEWPQKVAREALNG